jgi:hypothetical protein
MPEQSKSEPTAERGLRLWLPSILLAVFGALLILLALVVKLNYGGYSEFVRDLVHLFLLELGIGLIVGAVISVTIERYMAKRKGEADELREEKIRRNVFEALFETAIPREFVKEMYKSLFEPRFLREHLEIRFEFRPLQDGNPATSKDLLILKQIVSFHARNITDTPADHTVIAREYMLIEHPMFKTPFTEFRIKGSDKTIHLKKADIQSQEEKPDPFWHRIGPLVVKVGPNDAAEVCVVVEKICRTADTKTWITRHAAKNLRIVVAVDDLELYDHLEFTVDQSHRLDLAKTDSSQVVSQRIHEWLLTSPVLPFQGIILHWRPKAVRHA